MRVECTGAFKDAMHGVSAKTDPLHSPGINSRLIIREKLRIKLSLYSAMYA